jgi:hypothetical protein
MKEKFEFNRFSFTVFFLNSAILGIGFTFVIFFIMFGISVIMWQFYGKNIEQSGALAMGLSAIVIFIIFLILRIIISRVKKNYQNFKSAWLFLDDNSLSYINRKQQEYSFQWKEITEFKISLLKNGLRAKVKTSSFSFIFSNYEIDPMPIEFKNAIKSNNFNCPNFYKICDIFHDKATSAIIKDKVMNRFKKYAAK